MSWTLLHKKAGLPIQEMIRKKKKTPYWIIMIFGIGTDLVEISRIEKLLARFGEVFMRKILSHGEETFFHTKQAHHRASYLAKRFAAKEALLKALGTGLAKGLSWHHMEITANPDGAPLVRLTHAAHARALQQSQGRPYQVHLSLTDSQELAQAFVIMEAL